MSEGSGAEQNAGQFPPVPEGAIPRQRGEEKKGIIGKFTEGWQARREGLKTAHEARGLGEISEILGAFKDALSREDSAARGSAADNTAERVSTDALAARLSRHPAFRGLFPYYGSLIVTNPDGTPRHTYRNPFGVDDTEGEAPPDITFDQVRAAVEAKMTALDPQKVPSLIK